MDAPRVLIAIEPRMYAEVLAFSISRQRPHAEVSVLGPSEDLEDVALRLRPHLVVANRVPKAVGEDAFWVEVHGPRKGYGVLGTSPLGGSRKSGVPPSALRERVCPGVR